MYLAFRGSDMLHRIIRSIHHFLAGALLLSSVAPLQAQTARQRLLSVGHSARGAASAVVGGVRYSASWVNRKIEAGARNFPRWGRRRVANTLSRFAKPTGQERAVIEKYVNGQQLNAAEAVTWKKFRNRALSTRGAIATIVTIIIAILAAGVVYAKTRGGASTGVPPVAGPAAPLVQQGAPLLIGAPTGVRPGPALSGIPPVAGPVPLPSRPAAPPAQQGGAVIDPTDLPEKTLQEHLRRGPAGSPSLEKPFDVGEWVIYENQIWKIIGIDDRKLNLLGIGKENKKEIARKVLPVLVDRIDSKPALGPAPVPPIVAEQAVRERAARHRAREIRPLVEEKAQERMSRLRHQAKQETDEDMRRRAQAEAGAGVAAAEQIDTDKVHLDQLRIEIEKLERKRENPLQYYQKQTPGQPKIDEVIRADWNELNRLKADLLATEKKLRHEKAIKALEWDEEPLEWPLSEVIQVARDPELPLSPEGQADEAEKGKQEAKAPTMRDKIDITFWNWGNVILTDGTQWYISNMLEDDMLELNEKKDGRGKSREVSISDVVGTIDQDQIIPIKDEKGLSDSHQQLRELTEKYNKFKKKESVAANELSDATTIAQEALRQAEDLKRRAHDANDPEMIKIAEKAIDDYSYALEAMRHSEVGLTLSDLSLPQTNTQGTVPMPRVEPSIPEVKLLEAKPSN